MIVCKLKDISKTYFSRAGEVEALKRVSCEVNKGDFVVLAGPSGAGKTTLVNILGLLDTASAGTYEFNGTDISTYTTDQQTELRRAHVGFVFQSFNLMQILTAKENIALASELVGNTTTQAHKKAMDFLSMVGMEAYADKYPNELSGGQQQRVAIARALVKEPLLLVADEPTASLDSENTESIIEMMINLNKNLGSICVVCTHDERVIRVAPRLFHVHDGNVAER